MMLRLGICLLAALYSLMSSALNVLPLKNLEFCEGKQSEHLSLCTLDQVEKFILLNNENWDPSIRYRVGKILHSLLLDIHEELLASSPDPVREKQFLQKYASKNSSNKGFLDYFFGPPEPESHIEPIFNPEALVISRSRKLIEISESWLLPMIEKENILDFEAAHLIVLLYGDSLRFSKAQEFITKYQGLLFKYKMQKQALLARASYWVSRFGAYPVRDWVLQELSRWRSQEIDGKSDLDFFLWTESLKLSGLPQNTPDRRYLLDRLERLWVMYPKEESRQKVREIVQLLRIGTYFKPPTPQTMSLEELIEASNAWVRALDGEKAQKVLDNLFKLPSWKRRDQSLLWEAFKLHVKIYRIMDQRAKIPSLIQSYLQIHRYLKFQKDSATITLDIERALQIANWFWTYERTEEAKKILKDIVDFNKRHKTQYSLAEAEYYLARISEQSFAKKSAIEDLTESLKWGLTREMRNFVLWRRLFLKWELTASVKELETFRPDLQEIKTLVKDDSDQLQWLFWSGRIESLLGNKKEAISFFEKAYKMDSYSFYGALSGIALIELDRIPKNWITKVKKSELEPKWSHFFADDGKPKNPEFYSLSRVYFLAKAGFRHDAEAFFSSLDAAAWRYILSKKQNKSERLSFSRSVAWLRENLKDPMGALRMSEIARQAFGDEIEPPDLAYLYPLAFWDLIQKEAKNRSLNPWIVASLIRQESAFNPEARSWANALGLMQMIPPVAEEEATSMSIKNFKTEDLFVPETAIKLGTHHLSRLLREFDQSLICAFAAYNAGIPPVEKWKAYYPKSDPLMFIERISYKETRNYVQKLLRNYINYQRFYGDATINIAELIKVPGRKGQASVINYEGSNWLSHK